MTPTATERALRRIVASHLRVSPELVDLDQDLLEESGLDSVDVTTVLLEIEEAFAPLSLSDSEARRIRSLRELAAYIDRWQNGLASHGSPDGPTDPPSR
ncbi:MAG: acyl carrier protein [Vicinamibacterales bacterium]